MAKSSNVSADIDGLMPHRKDYVLAELLLGKHTYSLEGIRHNLPFNIRSKNCFDYTVKFDLTTKLVHVKSRASSLPATLLITLYQNTSSFKVKRIESNELDGKEFREFAEAFVTELKDNILDADCHAKSTPPVDA